MSLTPWIPDWADHWDAEVGLWWSEGPGHTAAVRVAARLHAGRENSLRLVQAAQVGELEKVEVARVLGALREMQATAPGKLQGCFRWYWEEPEPVDTNAAFFTTINLLALHLGFREKLDAESGALLDAMFADARIWFTAAVGEEQTYYPNKYLGDLVCAWLLLEVTGGEDADGALAAALLAAADYWQAHGWGWGEHMSDVYCGVCLQELSLLLLLARRLPEAVRERYRELLAELLAIEDAFDGGVRVPAIRSYAFAQSPAHVNYRDRVRDWDPAAPALSQPSADVEGGPGLENLFAARGWHDLVAPRAAARRDPSFPCFGGARAVGRCEPDIRLGSLTRFPFMPTAEHLTWGKGCQTFPVCFWRPGGRQTGRPPGRPGRPGDWGFLQWEVKAGGRVGAHPATGSFFTNYANSALALGLNPPVVGQTWAIQEGGNVVALRIMPAIQAGWEYLCDRFRLLDGHAQVEERAGEGGGWRQLLLAYPERTVSVVCLPLGGLEPEPTPLPPSLGGRGEPEASLCGGGQTPLDWEVRYPAELLEQRWLRTGAPGAEPRRLVVTLWGISLEGPITQGPVLEPVRPQPLVPRDPAEQAWRITWRWPGREWKLEVDPLAAEALRVG